jgi:LEA14-like dessication related protein
MLNLTRILSCSLLVLMVTGCASTLTRAFDEPRIELLGVRPVNVSNTEANFLVTLRVINPNAFALDIDGVYYDIFLRERKVLSGVSSDAVVIPAFGEGRLELTAAANIFQSISLVSDLMQTPPQNGLPYTLNTKISVAGWGPAIKLSHQGTIGAKVPAK